MSDNILQAGLQGVQGGLDQFGRAAGQIANSSVSQSHTSNSLESNLIEIKRAQSTVEASVKVISVADSIVGTVLDELA